MNKTGGRAPKGFHEPWANRHYGTGSEIRVWLKVYGQIGILQALDKGGLEFRQGSYKRVTTRDNGSEYRQYRTDSGIRVQLRDED